MRKQTLAVALGAVALFVIVLVATLALTGGDSGGKVHTMPGGSTMQGMTMP